MKEYASKSIANKMSRTFEFNISYPDRNLKLDQQFFKTVVDPLLKIVQRDVKMSFKVEIEHKGLSRSPEEELTKFEPALRRLKAEYFEKWTHEVFNYQISEGDKRNADEGQYHKLVRQRLYQRRLLCSLYCLNSSLIWFCRQHKPSSNRSSSLLILLLIVANSFSQSSITRASRSKDLFLIDD